MMKTQTITRLASIMLVGFIANATYAMPPVNLSCAKREVIAYYNSGKYEQDVQETTKEAEKYLLKRIQENHYLLQPHQLAMVLDIDDTSLSNFAGNKKRDFSGLPEMIDASYVEADAPAIEPVLQLYNKAIANGVKVFFITFRPESVRSYTITNLQKSGYYGWSGLYLANSDEVKAPAQVYKTNLRKMLTEQGYDIILNLGDQDSDLSGGFAEKNLKVPNPLYSTSAICPA